METPRDYVTKSEMDEAVDELMNELPEAERRPEPINGLLWIFFGGVFVGILIGVLI